MDLKTLCSEIHLQKEIQKEVLDYYQTADFDRVRSCIGELKDMKTEAGTREELKRLLGTDLKKVKMLTCMLVCAADIYRWYQEKGICEEIFRDTMRCFTRFIEECRQITGTYAFDREWWTSRQVSGSLFRIGELEYEMMHMEGEPVISIHIPSDAVFTRERCGVSLESAKVFFEKYFPAYRDKNYVCYSWLLAPELKHLLPPDSNILAFQSRFALQKVDYLDGEFIEWVFKTRDTRVMEFPEDTSLQKNMKQHLQKGGKIGTGLGILTS